MNATSLQWFRRAARVGAVLAAIVVVVGAWVRLTDAGLGCPDWPGCYGHAHPAAVLERLADAHTRYPDRPFDYHKALHEMVHRYIATTLGLVIVALAGVALWRRREAEQPVALPVVLVGVVCLQGALGAFTVTMLLKPLIVTLHLIGGLTTLGLLWWLSLAPPPRELRASGRRLRGFALLACAALVCQLLLGGWTSSNYAAVACPDFPTCQGTWLPATDLAGAFALSHGPGVDYAGGVLDLPARTAIHLSHRAGALLAGTLLLLVAIAAWRRVPQRGARRAALALAGAVLLQWLIGMNLIWQGFPLWLGTAHNAAAALLLLATLTLLRALWPAMESIRFASADGRRDPPAGGAEDGGSWPS